MFTRATAELWVPDAAPADQALARTTYLGISAHQDDLEIMCAEGILAAFGSRDRWFTGVVVTDGAGSPRNGIYADYDGEQMKAVRRVEQKKAAFVGEYGALALLDHPSAAVKDPAATDPVEDLGTILDVSRPEIVYTHNLADKHPTHIAVAIHVIRAIRKMPRDRRPGKLYGCEVWRDLDWMLDEDKVVFHLDGHENVAASLVGVFDSQIAGGKRYDLATLGRRRANATYYESHGVDTSAMIDFGMDLTPLIQDDALDITGYVMAHVDRFARSVRDALAPYA